MDLKGRIPSASASCCHTHSVSSGTQADSVQLLKILLDSYPNSEALNKPQRQTS